MKLTYCKLCLYPNTKPDLMFNEQGICSACTAFQNRENIDWTKREQEFKQLCDQLIAYKHQYHCVVPVSGGKDSHYQILKAKEYGLNPLAVCASTDDLSGIGRDNLNNISLLGVDLIEVTSNSKLRRKINKFTLQEIGDISWAEHQTIFSIPIRIAIQFNIPLILYGENPQSEYGGPTKQSQEATILNKRWLEEFGGLNGLRISDIIDMGIGSEQEINIYKYPQTDKITQALWLGQYFPWCGMENAIIANKYGFKEWYGPVEGAGYNYENLDNKQTGIHDRLKYLKFGFGRCTDLVNNHIRRHRITREEGKEIILIFDGKYPTTYLGTSLEEILEKIDMTVDEYLEVEYKFANKELFECKKGKIPRSIFKEILKNA